MNDIVDHLKNQLQASEKRNAELKAESLQYYTLLMKHLDYVDTLFIHHKPPTKSMIEASEAAGLSRDDWDFIQHLYLDSFS